jgi:hypothetical protein
MLSEEGYGLSRPGSFGLAGRVPALSTLSHVDAARPRALNDPVAASWTGLSPTDRSPPRA